MITSAALYFESQSGKTVPLQWFEEVRHFFSCHTLAIDSFHLWATGFSDEDTFDFGIESGKLVQALKDHSVCNLSLYSGLVCDESGVDWRGMASLDMEAGILFLGVQESIIAQPNTLLRSAFDLSRSVQSVNYGISYILPMSKGPDLYALGGTVSSLSDVLSSDPERIGLRAWLDEMQGAKKYLKGFFRGAYPATILSMAHLRLLENALGPVFSRIGQLTPLGHENWIWELAAPEIAKAQEVLRESRLLIQ